uniref:bifunctional UDP-N-acetylglucosamine diphosphorylase/glucosamine-1-phosphate N-acetyltransferase GlmU n=1 Tax=uncultured Anaerotruncus sp. TaxID=905011 RepID=UPI00280B85DA
GDALVLYGDAPFIEGGAITAALAQHRAGQNAVTLVSARPADPFGYGRIVRGEDGGVRAVVEERDCDEAERAITEINAGVYWFDAAFLSGALKKLTPQNAQGEYYLTDVPAIAVAEGRRVGAYFCEDAEIVLGANDRRQLLALNNLARERVLFRHLDNGVDIPCADGIMIGAQVEIGRDTRILPGTVLEGKTVIGPGCVIGPNSYIKDSTVGAGARVLASYLTDSTVGEGTRIGPFTQLRPNSHIGSGVKIGDFVEIKNSTVGDRTSVAHLTYIGDSDVGRDCNFGCGVVTANYDGKKKFRTTVGDRAFIGCNTNLIPPVHIGEGAYTAAGTTVDSDVPAGALAIGRVRQEIKEGWSDEKIAFKADKK